MPFLSVRPRLGPVQYALLTVAAIMLLTDAALFFTYLPLSQTRDDLARQVGVVERAVRRLQDRQAQPSALVPLPGENPFPADLPTAELTTLVVQSAQGAGVKIDSMTPALGAGERLVQNTYRSYRVSLRATGSPSQVVDMLSRIERGTVRSWVIDNVIARPSATGGWEIAFDVIAYAPLNRP
ncbi:MAG: hypothetical protein EPO26_12525 [Chloroflexota bacterium]|nr:MAG: hypothetical protein EPO26_12525 [Chloroflexota bacterium]